MEGRGTPDALQLSLALLDFRKSTSRGWWWVKSGGDGSMMKQKKKKKFKNLKFKKTSRITHFPSRPIRYEIVISGFQFTRQFKLIHLRGFFSEKLYNVSFTRHEMSCRYQTKCELLHYFVIMYNKKQIIRNVTFKHQRHRFHCAAITISWDAGIIPRVILGGVLNKVFAHFWTFVIWVTTATTTTQFSLVDIVEKILYPVG